MNKLLVSPEARLDLKEIKRYITVELENPIAAQDVTIRIIADMKDLRDSPGMGTRLSSKIPVETGYRFWVCGNYLIFYRYQDKKIFVDRILYGKRDYVKVLFPEIAEKDID